MKTIFGKVIMSKQEFEVLQQAVFHSDRWDRRYYKKKALALFNRNQTIDNYKA